MCGIAGYWKQHAQATPDLIAGMTRQLAHRGPDDEGYWLWNNDQQRGTSWSGDDTAAGIRAQLTPLATAGNYPHHLAFGHRRYAVIDLSDAGHQPLQRGPHTLIYNGEIYNFREIRAELIAHGSVFTTDTDAEVLLAAMVQWGTGCLPRLRGFFAFALHDAQRNTLLLARDHLGKAPLYVLRRPGALYFASDIKPILAACPEERALIRPTAVVQYVGLGLRDFQQQTFWQNIDSLAAASWLEYDLHTGGYEHGVFWNLPRVRQQPAQLPFPEAVGRFRGLLEQSVQRRLVADLPVGFTLSGGLDSSAIVALFAQQRRTGKAPVFTVRYADPRQDETPYAQKVVAQYADQVEHTILDGFQETLAGHWDAFFELQEEPFHDPVLFTDFMQQKHLKARGVGININGAGGDELLGGYPAYLPPYIRWCWQNGGLQRLPDMTAAGVAILENMPVADLWKAVQKRLPGAATVPWSAFLRAVDTSDLPVYSRHFTGILRQKMGDYLLNYWLRSQHKHYMGIPVEPRMPFLDVDLVEFSFTLPPEYLIHKGWTKYILRKAVEDILPPEIVWRRRKMGFPFDTQAWLQAQEKPIKAMLRNDPNNPWLRTDKLLAEYNILTVKQPQLLWRLLCLSLWYQKMILQQPLQPHG